MAVSTLWKGQKSGCNAVKDGSEVSQESQGLSHLKLKNFATLCLLSSSLMSYKVADMPSDATSVQEALRVMEELSSSQMCCMLYAQPESPIQDWIKLITRIHAVITELKQKLGEIVAEQDKVKKDSACALDQYEADMVARNAKIQRLDDQTKQCMSSLEESAQEEKEECEAQLKRLKKQLEIEEQRLEKSELKILGNMKTILNLRAEEEKFRRVLAEANLYMSKVENDLRKIERDTATAEQEKRDLRGTDFTKRLNSFSSAPSNSLSEPCH